MMQLPMSDGSVATYEKGSYHITHNGTTYLNYDSDEYEKVVFPKTATGELIDGKLHVKGYHKATHIFSIADTIEIRVKDGAESKLGTYVLGGHELRLGDSDVYLLTEREPLLFKPSDISGCVRGEQLLVTMLIGRRGCRRLQFERKTDEACRKRKQMDEQCHDHKEKRALVMQANAGRMAELAGKAVEAIGAMMDLESAMQKDSGVGDAGMFEDNSEPLETALGIAEAMKRRAEEWKVIGD